MSLRDKRNSWFDCFTQFVAATKNLLFFVLSIVTIYTETMSCLTVLVSSTFRLFDIFFFYFCWTWHRVHGMSVWFQGDMSFDCGKGTDGGCPFHLISYQISINVCAFSLYSLLFFLSSVNVFYINDWMQVTMKSIIAHNNLYRCVEIKAKTKWKRVSKQFR